MSDAQPNALQHSLIRLQQEIARAPRLDEHSKQRLRAALAEIERQIDQRGAAPAVSATPHPLEALAVGFEADHPAVAASLRQFIDLLGQAGL
jgi:hypothetical protein